MSRLLLARNNAKSITYVEDVFASTLYTGNGSSRTITSGIDLSTLGGAVWTKARSAGENHSIANTVVGADKDLLTNGTSAEQNPSNTVTAFGTTGHNLGTSVRANANLTTYVAWSFARAARFFDAFAYNGSAANAGNNYRINHNLGVTPGLVICKRRDATTGNAARDGWQVWHRSLSGFGGRLQLESTAAEAATPVLTNATSTYIEFDNSLAYAKESGINYVAYLFAHDAAADGIVQCGSGTTDGSGNATVTLGWEPQFVIYKSSASVGSWLIADTARGFSNSTSDAILRANTTDAEASFELGEPTSTGFIFKNRTASEAFVYLAIRRGPMRRPTAGTQVYNSIARTGTGATATVTGVGFPPDVALIKRRDGATGGRFFDRSRGAGLGLAPHASGGAEASESSLMSEFLQDGVTIPDTGNTLNGSGSTYIYHFLRRFPGALDIVCYSGNSSSRTIAHNLGAAPTMMFVKARAGTYGSDGWSAYHVTLGAGKQLYTSGTNAEATSATVWDNTAPTSTVFSVGADAGSNGNSTTYVAYLFGSVPGVCGTFTYSGSASPVTVSLGFTPRFIIIKRTDSTGGWYVFDTTRGIVSGNDPYLLLNSTAAEVTTADAIDPTAGGFIVNNVTTELNASGGTFVGWACA